MKRLSLLDIGKRLNGSIYDASENSKNALSIKQVIVGAIAVASLASGINQAFATPSFADALFVNSATVEKIQTSGNFSDSARIVGGILAKTNHSNSDIEFPDAANINGWSDMHSALKEASTKPLILIDSPYTGVEITYIVNAKQVIQESEALNYQLVQEQIAQDFANNKDLAQALSPRYLKKAPQLISNRSKANAELNHFNSSLEPMAFKTVNAESNEYLKVNVVHVENLHKPAYQIMNEISPQDYPIYNGELVNISAAKQLTNEEAAEISATFIAMHELGHSFMYRTLDVDKAMSDVTQGATTIEDLALSDFLSMTYSETIADSTMLIAGAKQLQSNEWESLKLDYLTMRANPDQYKSTSTDVHLSHNTTFFTKPLISFLDQYRQSPESYPEFSQMTTNLNSSAVAMTLLYHQVQIDAGPVTYKQRK